MQLYNMLRTSFTTAIILLASSCNQPPTAQPSLHQKALTQSSSLSAFGLTHRVRSASEIADISAKLASVLLGEEISGDESRKSVAAATSAIGLGAFDLQLHPHAKVTYREDNDDLGVINDKVTRDTSSTEDVGLAKAEGIYSTTLGHLLVLGVVTANGWDTSDITRSQIKQGEAAQGQPTTVRIKEYLFTVPRKINGVGVFNAGVTISVHRSGALARIRVFGPTADSVVSKDGLETPSGGGKTIVALVDEPLTRARLQVAYQTAEFETLGMKYFLPDGEGKGGFVALEPSQVYKVSPVLPAIQNGKHLKGKGFYVAYSITSPLADPIVWPRPGVPATPGDSKP